MEVLKKHGKDLHKEYLDWLSKFKFYEEEMNHLKDRVADILNKNSAAEIAALGEQLLNRVDVQRNNLQKIKDHLRHEEQKFAALVAEKPLQYEHILTEEEKASREDILHFEKQYPNLKEEVHHFLGKYL
jgi:hypothetical protein